jgi:hypothetical protein
MRDTAKKGWNLLTNFSWSDDDDDGQHHLGLGLWLIVLGILASGIPHWSKLLAAGAVFVVAGLLKKTIL